MKSFSTSLRDEYESEMDDLLVAYNEKQKRRQALVGVITSTKCAKSITVRVAKRKFYSKYNKIGVVHRNVMAHDENGLGKDGDLVRIVPCRPMSRKKRHSLIDIIKKAKKIEEVKNKPENVKK